MDEKIRKSLAVVMALMSLLVSITAIKISSIEAKENESDQKKTETEEKLGIELVDYDILENENMEEVLEHQMRIQLPEGVKQEEIVLKNNYLKCLTSISIPGGSQEYYYENPILGTSDYINELVLGSDGDSGIIDIFLDKVYEVEMNVKDSFLYLDFIPPQKLYDKVIVVDAGHGGKDPGAVKQGIYEKDINLAIVLEMKELLKEHENWKVYFTRTKDTTLTLDERVQLANHSQANVFVSVHNNSTRDGKMNDYHGTEVMFDEEKKTDDLGTKELAQICLEETVAVTKSRELGLTTGNSIYIIRTSQVPVALIEVGFMTSPAELAKLNTSDYQKKAAKGIYNGIVRALEEGF